MNGSKSVSLAIIILALLGMYLQSRQELIPSLKIIGGPNTVKPASGGMVTLGDLAVAMVGYFAVLSFLNNKQGVWLTVIIAMSALKIDAEVSKANGAPDVITTIFGKV